MLPDSFNTNATHACCPPRVVVVDGTLVLVDEAVGVVDRVVVVVKRPHLSSKAFIYSAFRSLQRAQFMNVD